MRDTIDDTLEWLERRKALALDRLQRSGTDQGKEYWISYGAHAAHAASLIRRAYRAESPLPQRERVAPAQPAPGEGSA